MNRIVTKRAVKRECLCVCVCVCVSVLEGYFRTVMMISYIDVI